MFWVNSLIPVVTLQNIKVTRSSQPCMCKGNTILFWWVDYSLFQTNGKNRNYLAHVCQFKTCCDLGHSVKVTDLISILFCLEVVFLLIWLQSTHWLSRYNIDNLLQYFIYLNFAVSVILWPYEMRSVLQNQILFLLKYIQSNMLYYSIPNYATFPHIWN